MIELTYTGTVQPDGRIEIPKRARKEIAATFAGKTAEVRIRQARRKRSDQQNRYYWGTVIPLIVQALYDLGNEDVRPNHKDSTDLVHAFLKSKFLPPIVVADARGEALELPSSTSKQTTSEMMDYITQIQQWAAECLSLNIPDPGEQLEFF